MALLARWSGYLGLQDASGRGLYIPGLSAHLLLLVSKMRQFGESKYAYGRVQVLGGGDSRAVPRVVSCSCGCQSDFEALPDCVITVLFYGELVAFNGLTRYSYRKNK